LVMLRGMSNKLSFQDNKVFDYDYLWLIAREIIKNIISG
jgi:hypothetical protein